MKRSILFSLAVLWNLATLPIHAGQATTPDAPPLPEPAGVLLRYRFQPGRFVHYATQSESRMQIVSGETSQTLQESRQIEKHYRIVSVDAAGSAVLEPVIDRVVMSAQTDDQPPVTFDSASSDLAPPVFRGIRSMIGRTTRRLRYSATGQLQQDSLSGGSVIRQVAASDDNDDATSEPDRSPAANETFLLVLPPQAVRPGDQWYDDYEVRISTDKRLRNPLTRPVTIRRRYTLERLEGRHAVISFRTYPLGTERDPQTQLQLIQQSLSGTVLFDLDLGQIVEWTSSGKGQVIGALGASSSVQASLRNREVRVEAPARTTPRGPAGPALPPGPAAPQ